VEASNVRGPRRRLLDGMLSATLPSSRHWRMATPTVGRLLRSTIGMWTAALPSGQGSRPPCRPLGTKPLQNQAICPAIRQCRLLADDQLGRLFGRRFSDVIFPKDVQSDNHGQSLGISMLGQPTFPHRCKWYKCTYRPHGAMGWRSLV
jgi:hypothetical protein